jgi:Domain of unknown function (DUF6458)
MGQAQEGSATMGIGASITLIALGAILAFGVRDNLSFVNLGNIGTILMVVGAIGLAVTVLIWGPRSRTRPPVEDEGEVVEERRVPGRRRPW